jgi:hypothetical protein
MTNYRGKIPNAACRRKLTLFFNKQARLSAAASLKKASWR